MQIELQEFVTKGDKILDVPLAKIGERVFFTKELEVAMLEGSASCCSLFKRCTNSI